MKLFLTTLFFLLGVISSQAQKNSYSFFAGIDYDGAYSINDGFDQFFVYNKGQYTNAGTAYLGIQKDNFYITFGATVYERTLDFPCVAFEEAPPNQVQLIPGSIIVYDTPNDNCEYFLFLEKRFIELPIGIGYKFSTNKKIDFFLEARYEPILTSRSYSKFGDLMLNYVNIQNDNTIRFHSWENISIRGGLLKNIYNNFALKLGVFLKSNDFELDKMLMGGNVGLQYVFK